MKRRLALEDEERRLRQDIIRDRDLVGGAIVRLPFFAFGKKMLPGMRMSREDVRNMPAANFDVMAGRYFTVIPEAVR